MKEVKVAEDHKPKSTPLKNSTRAKKGKLDLIKTNKAQCPYCHNHKFLENQTMTKCSRCKREVKL